MIIVETFRWLLSVCSIAKKKKYDEIFKTSLCCTNKTLDRSDKFCFQSRCVCVCLLARACVCLCACACE